MGRDKFLKLLNLLGDNKEKLNEINQAQNSTDLMSIYEDLPSGDNQNDKTSDYSQITDFSLKKEIINHPKIKIKDLWKVFKKEKNPELRKESFQNYCQKYPMVLCPRLFSKIINHGELIYNHKTINYFFISWYFFALVAMFSLFLNKLLILPICFFAINLLWFASKGFSNQRFLNNLENFMMGSLVLVALPLLIPIVCIGLIIIGGLSLSEHSFGKVVKLVYKKTDEDQDDYYDKINPWH
jgi:hypothetical protein